MSRLDRFFLSALPFIVGQGEANNDHRKKKAQPVGLPILNASMKIKRIEAERYFAEIVRKTTEKYAGVSQPPAIDEIIGSYVDIQMSKHYQ